MTPAFLAAVIDTLLPDEQTAPAESAALPAGSMVGLDLDVYANAHRRVLGAIVAEAGGDELFLHADEATRATILRAVERAAPDAFRALLVTVLSDYYETPAVLAALGWRMDPPQPTGHAVPTPQDLAAGRLAFAQRRGKLWRG
jgi:hypothetical protein